MPVGEDEQNRGQPQINRRKLLSTAAGAAVAGVGVGAFSGTALAWDRFDVEFRSENEVWLIVGDDLHYNPPLVTHVVVETDNGPECRLVEFTENSTATFPDHYGDHPVVPYDAGSETVLGVLPYNRHVEGDGQFSRPRCVLLNDNIDEEAAADACQETSCVQAAMEDHWDGNFKQCWFDPIESSGEEDDDQIDECTAITEPGTYELASDLEPGDGDACIEILADDVTIEGNGYAIDGSGLSGDETVGIETDAVDESDADGVTIRDIELTGFDRGVSVAADDLVEIEDTVIEECERGVDLGVGQSDAAVQLSDVTIESCTEQGVRSAGFNTLEIEESTLRENGTGVSASDTTVEIAESSIRDNADDGVVIGDGTATVSDTTIEENGGNGLSHMFLTLTLDETTIRSNDGNQLGVIEPGDPEDAPTVALTATDFAVGESTTVTDGDTSLNALDTIEQSELPSLPEDATPVADGFEVLTRVSTTLDVDFDTGSDEADGLRRYDGSDWEIVEDVDVGDDTVEATIEQEGIYVPVEG